MARRAYKQPRNAAAADEPVDKDAARWKLQIEHAERDAETWIKRGEDILKRYRDERADDAYSGPRRYNVLWSNVQTLKPSIYGREPVPVAERRFLDKDVVGRTASQILERAMRYEMHDCGFNDTVTRCVYDYLLPGRGVAWWRFTPKFGPASSIPQRGEDQLQDIDGAPVEAQSSGAETTEYDESDEPTDDEQEEKLVGAKLDLDYVNWKDLLHSKARTWEEVEWLARRIFMGRQDLVDTFGEEIGNAVPLDRDADERKLNSATRSDRLHDGLKKATVYEIWCKYDRKVYFVAKGFDRLLKEPTEDPLNLEGFWPCPKPLFATMTNDTLIPVPDYAEYQDQAYELDRLTQRIDLLLSALRVAGVYDSSVKELARILDEGGDNKLIPVASWAAFAQKGGVTAAISFLPIKEIADVLTGLFDAREKILNDLYQITGLSDIIRGQADPRETATAIQTKGKWGSLRLQDRQAEVARFCRDIIRMMGEIISEHYPDETLITVSGIMYEEGVGPEMPTPPKPDQQPSPMMGHNGGPPMGGAPPGSPQAGPGAPPPQASSPVPQSPQGLQPQPAPPVPLAYAQQMEQVEAEKAELIQKSIGLLRQDKLRGFRIDIETDSTIQQDANEDKAARVSFVEAMAAMLEKGMQAAQLDPTIVPLIGKMLLFAARGFRTGRELESALEEYIDEKEKAVKKMASMPKPPDPKVEAAQMSAQADMQKSQAEIAKAKLDAQSSAEDNQRDMAAKQMDMDMKRQQMAMDQQNMEREAAYRAAEFNQKMAELQMKMRIAEQDHAHKTEQMHLDHQHKLASFQMQQNMPNGMGGGSTPEPRGM